MSVMSLLKKQKTGNEASYSSTSFGEFKKSHIWKIKGFLTKCPLKNGEWIESSKFKVAGCGSKFYMNLFPKGDKIYNTDVSLFLHIVEGQQSITCEFALVDTSGKVVNKLHFQNKELEDSTGFGFHNFISRDELQEQKLVLLPDDELTVSCVVTIYGEDILSPSLCGVSACADSTLLDDLASCFDRKEGADVLLKVGGDSIPAHKSILMCRSEVFAAMFKSAMREGKTGKVRIRDMDRDVLVSSLSFLCTDRLSIPDVEFALKLLLAADRYAVQSLQSRCAQYLAENLSTSNVYDILRVAEACFCKELCQKCVLLIEREMSLIDIVTQLESSPHLIPVMKEHLKRTS